jgi:hypothetical protein
MIVIPRHDLRRNGTKPRPLSRVRQVVIHRSHVSDDLDEVAAFYANPKNPWRLSDFPYHWWIAKDGTIFQIHSLDVTSPHAAGLNTSGVGVALNFNGLKEPPTGLQEIALRELIRSLQGVLGRQLAVVGHSIRKRCPGPFFNMESLLRDLEAHDD